MASVTKTLTAEECSEIFRNIEYKAKAKVNFGKNNNIVLVGLGILHCRKVFGQGVDKAVSGIWNELAKKVNEGNKEYFEFFVTNLNNGVDLVELSKDENNEFVVENFMYWFVSYGKSIVVADGCAANFSEENEIYWECLCENLGISLIVDSENGGYCFGKAGNFPVVYIWNGYKEQYLMLGADLLSLNVKQIYNSLIAGNLASQLLKLTNKVIDSEKRQKFIEITEKLIPHFILSPEIHKCLAELKSRKCDHKYYYLFVPLCQIPHCSLCLFESCKNSPLNEMVCLCNKPLSPKNFCELSQLFTRLNKKQLKSSFFNTSNLPKLFNFAQSFIKTQHPVQQEVNSSTCLICQNVIPSNFLFKICINHQQCRQCLLLDQQKCQYCKKVYSPQDKQKILNLV